MPGGRPTTYSDELAAEICSRMSEGESLRKICASEGMPAASTVFKWVHENEQFSKQYAKSRSIQMEHMAEDLIEIADDTQNDKYLDDNGNERTNNEAVNRSRLRVDTRKWLMSKMAPKKYGEKLDTTNTTTNVNVTADVSNLDFSKLTDEEVGLMAKIMAKAKKQE